jgi:5-methylcytosine-specific restriction endonuclease McrA
MGKRLPYTPNSKIINSLRNLFLRSRERATALKRDNYTCQRCGKKQSRAKDKEVYIEVHHKKPVDKNWDIMLKCIRDCLLVNPEEMISLCKECHKNAHEKM